jgi:hypothetical protein
MVIFDLLLPSPLADKIDHGASGQQQGDEQQDASDVLQQVSQGSRLLQVSR